jgi:hypothetical protein
MTDQLFRITQIKGTETTEINISDLAPVQQVLLKFANRLIENSQNNLDRQNINASFNLSSSIVPLPEVNGNQYTLEIQWPNYGKYVDQGVQGIESGDRAQGSPFQIGRNAPFAKRRDIAEWITAKGIHPGGRRGQRIPTRDQLSYAITKSVNRYGTKRTLFFSDALTSELQSALINDVAEALGKSISISMKL